MSIIVKFRCPECGSSDLRRDAWAEWNQDRQEFELGDTFDFCFCVDCDKETHPERIEQ